MPLLSAGPGFKIKNQEKILKNKGVMLGAIRLHFSIYKIGLLVQIMTQSKKSLRVKKTKKKYIKSLQSFFYKKERLYANSSLLYNVIKVFMISSKEKNYQK